MGPLDEPVKGPQAIHLLTAPIAACTFRSFRKGPCALPQATFQTKRAVEKRRQNVALQGIPIRPTPIRTRCDAGIFRSTLPHARNSPDPIRLARSIGPRQGDAVTA